MNGVAQQVAPVTFHVEQQVTTDQLLLVIKDLLPKREENFAAGFGARGHLFEPHFELIVAMMQQGIMRWITARQHGEIIGLQQWSLVPHLWSKNLIMATCESIIGGRKSGIDIKAFVKFGATAMRGMGAGHVMFVPNVDSSFEAALREIGAKPAALVMEI